MADDLQNHGLLLPRGAVEPARPLIGRSGEVRSLMESVAGLASGTGRAVAVVGEPGIGKSSVLAEAVAQARAAGVAACTLRGRSPSTSSPPGTPPASDVQDAALRAAEGTPLVVSVDDLHRVPTEELHHVEQLLRAASTGPVVCILAYRQRQLSPMLAEILAHASSDGVLEVWNLQPLTSEQARELLGEHPHADEVLGEAMGNPSYLKVLGGVPEARAQAATAVLGELAGLDADALAVVEAAAVLGQPFDAELMAAVADLPGPSTVRILDRLARLDLLRSCEPGPRLALRHRALGEVVYEWLDPGRRTALHRRAEAELARQAAPIVSRARHVARAADPNRPEDVTTLIAAARSVLYSSPSEAVGYLRAALPLLREDQEHWHEAHVLLARAQLVAGDTSESRALLDSLRSAVSGPPAEVTELAMPSRAERRLGRLSEAGALARSALAGLADRDSVTAAALHIELADHAYDVQDFETSRHHAETAAVLARRHHDRVGESQALGQAALARLFTGDENTSQATAAADLIDAAPDTVLLTNLDALLQLGITEGVLGRLADAERHVARAATLARRTGQKHVEQNALTSLANAQARSGNLPGARATLDECARWDDRGGEPATRAISATLRAEVLWWLGGFDDPSAATEAAAAADLALSIASGSPANWAVTVRCFHAELVLHGGDPARARLLLLDAAGGDALPRLTTWRKPRWCDTLAEAAQATGDPASVEHWARLAERCLEELPSAGRRGFALRARMRACAARGDIGEALRSAQAAIADFSGSGERIELCRTLLAAVALSLDAGRLTDLAAWLDRAAYLAGQCGSARLAEEVTRHRGRLTRLAATVPKSDATASLTAREREVAELVSTGMTNNEIAKKLFLSVRTVETHLGQIYRKLGVANRAGLTRALLARAVDPAPPTDTA
ncbi:helix-turn-helix transcriptional regulator [Streptomyces sasae]|uniref:helix-turn-helix transcriptional regulator n=1 Tax=Streptomyces sasae TaxID=1266772 RepID=UPI00292ED3AA|nr:LuxR C-terminal-related transcriptional regulator [Streptomyces sasae]